MNPLINEISQNLPQPSDFGVGNSEYKSWENNIIILENEINSLGLVPKEYKSRKSIFYKGLLFVGLLFFIFNEDSSAWDIVSNFTAWFFLYVFVFSAIFSRDNEYSDEYKLVLEKINNLRERINEQKNKKNKIDSEYHSAKRKYIDRFLNQYRDIYLYRKRSESYGFAEKLQIYSDASEHFSGGDYLDYFNDHRKYVSSRDIKVTPYKRPAQRNLNKSEVTNDMASVQSSQTASVVKQNSITAEDLELVLENIAINMPPQQVGKQINNGDNLSSSDIQNQEKLNMVIGDIGEEAVANYEKKQFQKNGRNYLAERVEIVSKTIGDGLGYDVLSFDQYGNEKFIEVKTTRSDSPTANFSFTRGELNFLTRNPDTAFVYCVFGVNQNNPRLKIYPAKQFLDRSFEPVEYRASLS